MLRGGGAGPEREWSWAGFTLISLPLCWILVGTEDTKKGQSGEKNGWASLKTALCTLVRVGKKGQARFRASVRGLLSGL